MVAPGNGVGRPGQSGERFGEPATHDPRGDQADREAEAGDQPHVAQERPGRRKHGAGRELDRKDPRCARQGGRRRHHFFPAGAAVGQQAAYLCRVHRRGGQSVVEVGPETPIQVAEEKAGVGADDPGYLFLDAGRRDRLAPLDQLNSRAARDGGHHRDYDEGLSDRLEVPEGDRIKMLRRCGNPFAMGARRDPLRLPPLGEENPAVRVAKLVRHHQRIRQCCRQQRFQCLEPVCGRRIRQESGNRRLLGGAAHPTSEQGDRGEIVGGELIGEGREPVVRIVQGRPLDRNIGRGGHHDADHEHQSARRKRDLHP